MASIKKTARISIAKKVPRFQLKSPGGVKQPKRHRPLWNSKIYLEVQYEDRYFAKDHGAKFDWDVKKWFVFEVVPKALQKYHVTPSDDIKKEENVTKQKIYLKVQYEDRFFAKDHGAKFDWDVKKWFVFEVVPEALKKFV